MVGYIVRCSLFVKAHRLVYEKQAITKEKPMECAQSLMPAINLDFSTLLPIFHPLLATVFY